MSKLLVVGGGLFGSLAAAYARARGIEALIFDPRLPGAASHAAAGLFKEEWAGRTPSNHLQRALPLLEAMYGIQKVSLTHVDGHIEEFLFVPPSRIIEPQPRCEFVKAVGDGWLEAAGIRYEGWIYVAAGVWCNRFLPSLNVYGMAGAAFLFDGEHPGRIQPIAHGRQAVAFARDPGTTYFSDGTAERILTVEHERQSLARAKGIGLETKPIRRLWGQRPYVPGGPVFSRIGTKTWLATGGRKMGTIVGASFARKLIDEELQ